MAFRPAFVFAYANDLIDDRRFLRNLPDERRRIRAAFRVPQDAGRCELVELPNATVGELLDECQRKARQLTLLHFAGHADGRTLLFESSDGHAQPTGASSIAEFLGGIPGLALVVLNGCSTRAHVDALLAAGIRSVVATSRDVRDDIARAFAERFYRAITSGASIGESFAQASGGTKAEFAQGAATPTRSIFRDIVIEEQAVADEWPWQLHGSAAAVGRPLLPPAHPKRVVVVATVGIALAAAVIPVARWASEKARSQNTDAVEVPELVHEASTDAAAGVGPADATADASVAVVRMDASTDARADSALSKTHNGPSDSGKPEAIDAGGATCRWITRKVTMEGTWTIGCSCAQNRTQETFVFSGADSDVGAAAKQHMAQRGISCP